MKKILQRFLIATLALAAGCVSFHNNSEKATSTTGSIRRGTGKTAGQVPMAVVAAEVSRFADEFTVMVSQAADTFAAQAGTPEARAAALGMKTGAASTAMIIATGPKPMANVLDMVVLATLGRMTCEDYWVPHYGKPAEAMLSVSRELEAEAWDLADRVLTRPQETELKELIQEWREKHPDQVHIAVRFRDFAELATAQEVSSSSTLGSLFSLSFLDPFSGLDPTTRELAQTRFFAERALYVFERMPKILRWQTELVVAQTLATPEVQQLVSNTTGFARSADQLTQAVQKLPEQLTAQTPELRALSEQLQHTFRSGNEMAQSVDAAVKSLDAFVERVSRPAAGETNTNQATKAGKPFDVTEYGVAAAEIGKAAQQLDTLTHSLEKTSPEIGIVVERTGLQGKELVDYTYRKALCFLLLALAGLVVALLTCRWITIRLIHKPKGS